MTWRMKRGDSVVISADQHGTAQTSKRDVHVEHPTEATVVLPIMSTQVAFDDAVLVRIDGEDEPIWVARASIERHIPLPDDLEILAGALSPK